jgi:hypothetical protein
VSASEQPSPSYEELAALVVGLAARVETLEAENAASGYQTRVCRMVNSLTLIRCGGQGWCGRLLPRSADGPGTAAQARPWATALVNAHWCAGRHRIVQSVAGPGSLVLTIFRPR